MPQLIVHRLFVLVMKMESVENPARIIGCRANTAKRNRGCRAPPEIHFSRSRCVISVLSRSLMQDSINSLPLREIALRLSRKLNFRMRFIIELPIKNSPAQARPGKINRAKLHKFQTLKQAAGLPIPKSLELAPSIPLKSVQTCSPHHK